LFRAANIMAKLKTTIGFLRIWFFGLWALGFGLWSLGVGLWRRTWAKD
jgi:hypothetical protein